MANAAQNSVAERRLRPIYDWLDNGYNKKALQEAERVLKKQPDFQCAKALMSLALLRMGRETEASPILDSLLNASPVEEPVLQAMTIAFREMQQSEKICTMYEKATQKEPLNEELLSHLFMSYVRLGEYKKQQQTALQLYKARPKNPYYFWAVMSVVLQALNCPDSKMALNVMLPLAERMVIKMQKEGKLEQEQETQLYLMILEMQDKYEDALDLLEGPIGQSLEETTSFIDLVPKKKLSCLIKLEKWARVNLATKSLLQKCPDQWDFYLDYCHSVSKLVSTGEGGANYPDDVDATFEEAEKYLTFQQKNNPKCRGPLLAQIELLLQAQNSHSYDGDTLKLLVKYFEIFGSKPCCAFDLKKYFQILDKSQTEEFFQATKQFIETDEDKVPKTPNDVQRQVSWYQLRMLTGFHCSMTLEEKHEFVEELHRLHSKTLVLFKDVSSKTEQTATDMYVVFIGHILFELWTTTGKDSYFWKAITLLVSKISAANYHIIFLVIKFLNRAGAVGAARFYHYSLELKHVQLDTLGYLLCRHILTCAHFAEASTVIGNTLKFFTGNYKDTVDHIISSYRCGSFSKIREFIALRERLSNSLHYTALTVERMLMDLFTETSLHPQTVRMISYLDLYPEKDEIKWDKLRDNRDFEAILVWEPLEVRITQEQIDENFRQEKEFLRFRSLIMRSVAAAVYLSEEEIYNTVHSRSNCLSNGSSASDQPRHHQKLLLIIGQLIQDLEKSRQDCQSTQCLYEGYKTTKIQHLDRPRLAFFLRDDVSGLVVLLLKLVIFSQELVAADEKTQTPKETGEGELLLKRIGTHLSQLVAEQDLRLKNETGMTKQEEHFESLTNIAESFSFASILFGVCHTLLSSVSKVPSNKKSKKKKNFKPEVSNFIAHFNETIAILEKELKKTLELINALDIGMELDKLKEVSGLENNFSNLSLRKEEKEERVGEGECDQVSTDAAKDLIMKSLSSSYDSSIQQIIEVIKKKLEYLGGIKF